MISSNEKNTPKFLEGGGEMGQIIRDMDWTSTPLGKPEGWPLSLKFAISSMLKTKFPNFIFWGEDLRCFYNDAYRPSLGIEGKHHSILGQKGKEAWPEIWDTIHPLLKQVWETGEATWSENQLIPFYRNGKIENIYWTFSYSSLIGDDQKIGGILTTCTETTDAVVNLQRLKESENQLKFAIDAAELGTWDYSPHNDKFTGNDRLKNWFGLDSKKEMNLSLAIQTIIPADQKRVTSAIAAALKGENEGKYSINYTIENKKTTEKRIVHVLGRAWFDEKNQPYRFNGTMQDVTEKYLAEKERLKLHAIIENSNDLISLATLDSKMEYLNKAGLKLLGCDSLSGLTILDCIHKEDKEIAIKLLSSLIKTGSFSEEIRFQNTLTCEAIWMKWNGFTIKDPDTKEVVGIATICTDINEQRERELILKNKTEQLQLALDVAEMAMWEIDSQLESATGDKRLRDWYGLSEHGHFDLNLGLNQVLESHREKVKYALAQCLDFNHGFLDIEYPMENPNTRIQRIIRAKGRTWFDEQKKPVRMIGVMQDISQIVKARTELENFSKELEKQVEERTEQLQKANSALQDSVKKLENANVELESFAYISSHDLQEPLRKIQIYTSRIKDHEEAQLTEKGKKYFDKINVAASRMRTLIDDLLTFSRTDVDDTQFVLTDLNKSLKQVLDNLSDSINLKEARVESEHLPMINGVWFQMRQVFSNLLSNSIKFSKENTPPLIKITCENTENVEIREVGLNQDISYHKITLTDNGIGFPMGMENRIFEVFQRLHGKHEFEGTGIGLSIVKKIMVNHGGDIIAHSSKGKGATFVLYLPKMDTIV